MGNPTLRAAQKREAALFKRLYQAVTLWPDRSAEYRAARRATDLALVRAVLAHLVEWGRRRDDTWEAAEYCDAFDPAAVLSAMEASDG